MCYDIAFVAKRFQIAQTKIRFWIEQFDLKVKKSTGAHFRFTETDLEDLREIYYLVEVKRFTIEGAIAERKSLKYPGYANEIAAMLRVF